MQLRVELISVFELIRVFDNWIPFFVISLMPSYVLHYFIFCLYAINDYLFLSQIVFENTVRPNSQKYFLLMPSLLYFALFHLLPVCNQWFFFFFYALNDSFHSSRLIGQATWKMPITCLRNKKDIGVWLQNKLFPHAAATQRKWVREFQKYLIFTTSELASPIFFAFILRFLQSTSPDKSKVTYL